MRHHILRRYRIRDWRDYNKALVGRGNLTLWVDTRTTDAWLDRDWPARRGRPAPGLLYEDTGSIPQDDFEERYDKDEEGNIQIKRYYSTGETKSTRSIMREKIDLKVSRSKITNLGTEFLSFITSPIPKPKDDDEF